MRINIVQATNIDLTDAITDYLDKKLAKLSAKLIDPNDESAVCDVDLGKKSEHHKNGEIFRAEFNLHIAGKDMYAEAEEIDLYAAIDEARDELERQLKSHQKKRTTLIRKGGKKLKDMIRGWNPWK
ncbi:MAG: ribosome-associated translation inhibitor RaiA [Candidatus Paceibacterota bacterium]